MAICTPGWFVRNGSAALPRHDLAIGRADRDGLQEYVGPFFPGHRSNLMEPSFRVLTEYAGGSQLLLPVRWSLAYIRATTILAKNFTYFAPHPAAYRRSFPFAALSPKRLPGKHLQEIKWVLGGATRDPEIVTIGLSELLWLWEFEENLESEPAAFRMEL